MLAFRTFIGPIFYVLVVLEWYCAYEHQMFGALRTNWLNCSIGHYGSPSITGGSAIELSATDAKGDAVGDLLYVGSLIRKP